MKSVYNVIVYIDVGIIVSPMNKCNYNIWVGICQCKLYSQRNDTLSLGTGSYYKPYLKALLIWQWEGVIVILHLSAITASIMEEFIITWVAPAT